MKAVRRALRSGLSGVALVAALAPAAAAADTDWTSYRPLHIAHQGGEDEVPSATMYALERSLRLGADMLEVDVHLSADGHLVVIHDATVDRTTNGSGRVYDMTLEQIQALDAGYNTVPGVGIPDEERPAGDYPFRGIRTGDRRPPRGYEPRDFRIPTLAEVMGAYPEVPINIEIKGASDADIGSFLGNAEALAAYLNGLGRTDGIMVASFNDAALERFHELAPQIDLAPGVLGIAGYLAGVAPPAEYTAFQVPTEFGGIPVANESFIARAHADGRAVHVWTINDEEEMTRLLDAGADGIMTAEPIRLESVLCKGGYARPPRPAGTRGARCNPRASIACSVAAESVRAGARALRVKLVRRDEFESRCAGRLKLRVGRALRHRARFSFGDTPPSAGGAREQTVFLDLSRRERARVRPGRTAVAVSRPYTSPVTRTQVEIQP